MPDTQTAAPVASLPASLPPAERIRVLEDRCLTLETRLSSVDSNQSDLRTEMRHEIASLRSEIEALSKSMENSNRQINGKLDRLFGARAVVTAAITLLTSILGSGVVHMVVSIGK
ncbi:hypothetical protein HKD24_04120 [Gluconobacter sp. LMG 31484]|uniref:DUF1640 domain-containing protein n=1 Tax=Gluconobacter vitians TaxID=2728102 RepID=A0ABR9Y3H3_9PROT|nr:hypothetical protein [Gluconobacter vitians]MBF0858402.1 hypothetical protein [Gluconobacter vitians]